MASTKYNCPQCNKHNFSFDNVKLTGQCFSCGYSAGGKWLLDVLQAEQQKYTPRIKTATPPLTEPKGVGREYLESRGVTADVVRAAGIKWDGEQVYLPIWCPLDGSRSWVRRKPGSSINYSDGQPGIPYVLGRMDVKNRMSCTLVEGPFSLLSPGLWGLGFSLLGSNLDERLERWLRSQRFEQIVIWFDPDDVGFTKGTAIHRRLAQWHNNIVRVHGWMFDARDPGEYDYIEAGKLMHACRTTGHWTPPKPYDACRRLQSLGIQLDKRRLKC